MSEPPEGLENDDLPAAEVERRAQNTARRMLTTPKVNKARGAEAPLTPSPEKLGRRRDRDNDAGNVKPNSDNEP
jgi:hypothetical protein